MMTRKILTLILLFISICTFAQQGRTIAFPGAEGFGRYTTGGRGGEVCHVTTLEDGEQEGTFRWACKQKTKRTIVFDVSGTIQLKSELKLDRGDVTIAGQTAPGDGICIAGYPFVLSADNVIIRFMRFRLGNENVAYHEGDGLGGMDRNNIIIDHCSVSWSIDECLSVYGSTNLTVQWCIAAQSLVNSGHAKGSHGYGGNWGGSGATYHHNLLAHHASRVPRLGPRPGTQEDERVDLRNNVFYNWAGNGCYGGEGMNVNIVNNYYKPGPATATLSKTKQQRIAAVGVRTSEYTGHYTTPNQWDKMWHVWGRYFVDGNVNPSHSDVTADNWTYGMYNQIDAAGNDGTYNDVTKQEIRLGEPIAFAGVTTHTAATAYEKVLAYAGASLHRDAFDKMMVEDTRGGKASCTGTGNLAGLINGQDDVVYADGAKGFPVLTAATAPTDTDRDGMPDDWERKNGLDPADETDGALTAENGYTNLENYMNSLVEDIMTACTEGGVYADTTEPEPEIADSYEISHTTHEGSDGWSFSNGFTVTTGKGYASASSLYVKYSTSETFVINIPGNMAIEKVRFIGYGNADDIDTYLEKLGSDTYDTEYVFPKGKTANNNREHTITLSTPASKTLPLKFKGGQACVRIILYPVKNRITQSGGEYIIDANTATSDNRAASPWTFKSNNVDFTVINTAGKTFGAEKGGIKYSAGTQFTITIPKSLNVSRVKISGYDKDATIDSYLAELNGETFDKTKYVFPAGGDGREYTMDVDASAELTFKPGGKQVVWSITLYSLPEMTISEHSAASDLVAGPANVRLVRTLSSSYWNSFCVPFDISEEKIAEVMGGAELLCFSSVNGNAMVFESVAGGIKAGVPYLIKPRTDVVNPRFEGVNVVSDAPQSVTIDGCSYIGTYIKYAMAYGGTELMFNTRNGLSRPKQAPGNVMRGLRAFFRVPAAQSASIMLMLPGGTTGITDMQAGGTATAVKGVYNLNGQFMGNSADGLPRGIYIVNGKKTVISGNR